MRGLPWPPPPRLLVKKGKGGRRSYPCLLPSQLFSVSQSSSPLIAPASLRARTTRVSESEGGTRDGLRCRHPRRTALFFYAPLAGGEGIGWAGLFPSPPCFCSRQTMEELGEGELDFYTDLALQECQRWIEVPISSHFDVHHSLMLGLAFADGDPRAGPAGLGPAVHPANAALVPQVSPRSGRVGCAGFGECASAERGKGRVAKRW